MKIQPLDFSSVFLETVGRLADAQTHDRIPVSLTNIRRSREATPNWKTSTMRATMTR